MYLSLLKLNPAPRKTRDMLVNRYTLHQSVYRAFPDGTAGGPGRVLYRLDHDRRTGLVSLLVQSEKRPEWLRADYLNECLAGEAQTKPYAPEVKEGQRFYFLLRANPSVKKQTEGKRNGYRLGLLREQDQLEWLRQKAATNGFSVLSCRAIPEGIIHSESGGKDRILRHYAVRFEGKLEVVDAVRFDAALNDGIGSAKGFGFGLLSIAPLRN